MTNNTNTAATIDADNITTEDRIAALSSYLELTALDAEPTEQQFTSGYIEVRELDVNGESYLVLTDEEANTAARAYIVNTLWAFSPSFLAEQTELPAIVFETLAQQYEDANDAVTQIVEKCGDMDDLVSDAIEADGRGHFLNTWDGEENEHDHGGVTFYIYRTA
jgi:hypothetical protein